MANGNNVDLVGTLGADVELRFTPSGQAVANFRMAVTRKWQNRQTQAWEEATSWFQVVCWGTLGENVAESLVKGARVIVTGRLEQRSWETESGEKRSVIEVIADEVGPSLRWATASVVRNERQGGSFDGGTHVNPSPQPVGTAAAPAWSQDEEPFRVDAGDWMPGAWGEYPTRMLGGAVARSSLGFDNPSF